MSPRIAVVGGGWAGIAAAVEAVDRGAAVTLYEMAPQLGGRARSVDVDGLALDNGQHILIGAYTATLRLMAHVSANHAALLERLPLQLTDPRGRGLRLPSGAPIAAFVRGVLAARHWPIAARLALIRAAAGWALRRFRCDAGWSVATLAAALPPEVRAELIEPLTVAALNTPAADASAQVFLRVLRDALFAGPGSADLLLPRRGLSDLLPAPAQRWLGARGARVALGLRVQRIEPEGNAWLVDGERFDAVVLAAAAGESARLAQPLSPAWASLAESLRHEPIVTVYARSPGTRLAAPMLLLASDARAPAQFVFDRGRLGGHDGVLAFVASGARDWADRGAAAAADAVLAQASVQLAGQLAGPLQTLRVLTEKRATFRCTPGLVRPPMRVASNLHAAGDHVAGPYPATLEGAVRSGIAAVAALEAFRVAG